MNRARVDALLPVHRAAATVEDAVADLLQQQDVSIRVVAVVDRDADGTDDGSLDRLRRLALDEPRLTVLEGQRLGLGPALDLGLRAVETPWVVHMEADDRCPPHRVHSLLAAAARSPNVHAVASRVEQIGDVTSGMRRYLAWQNDLLSHAAMARERFVEIPALHQTGLYRTATLRELGGYTPRGPWPHDIDFWLRWFAAGEHEVVKTEEVLYGWRQHERQSTRSRATHSQDALRAAKVHDLASRYGRAGRAPRRVALVSVGRTLTAWSDALVAADVDLVAAHAWRSGRPFPSIEDDALVLAVFGMAKTRAAVRAACPERHEPDDLLFAA